jgi:hypothetical protein
MADLPKELFEIGTPDKKRVYYFTNIYGKKDSVELDFGDRLSYRRCILDGAYIVAYSADPHTVAECPACKHDFEGTNEEATNYLKNYFIPNTKDDITRLKTELNLLEKLLKLAENPENSIRKENLKRK